MSALPSMSSSMLRASLSTEVREPEKPLSIAVHSTDRTAPEPALSDVVDVPAAIELALSRAGLSSKVACAHMDKLDPALWARQLQGKDGAHISVQRLSRLQLTFWREFVHAIAPALGVVVASQDISQLALRRALAMVVEIATVAEQQQTLRRAG